MIEIYIQFVLQTLNWFFHVPLVLKVVLICWCCYIDQQPKVFVAPVHFSLHRRKVCELEECTNKPLILYLGKKVHNIVSSHFSW